MANHGRLFVLSAMFAKQKSADHKRLTPRKPRRSRQGCLRSSRCVL